MTKEYGYKVGETPSLKQPCSAWLVFRENYYSLHTGFSIWDVLYLMVRVVHPYDHNKEVAGGVWTAELTLSIAPFRLQIDLPFWYSKKVSLLERQQRCGNDSMSGSVSPS